LALTRSFVRRVKHEVAPFYIFLHRGDSFSSGMNPDETICHWVDDPAAKIKMSRANRSRSIHPEDQADLARTDPSQGLRYTRRDVSASEVTRALSRVLSLFVLLWKRVCASSYTRNGGCLLLLGFFLLASASPRRHSRRPRSNLDPIAGSTTISIPLVTKPAIYGGDLLPYL